MNTLTLVWKNITREWGATLLSVILTAFGIAILLVIYISGNSFEKQLTTNSRNVDLVVGAKGSPLQLILSTLFHVDNPTGNISLAEAKKIADNPLIKLAVPISLGDNYKGHRIIGTDSTYLELYGLQIKEGHIWKKSFEVVLGAEVARKNNLKIGDEIHSAHGLSPDAHIHDDHPFKIVGILAPSGSIVDNLILTNLASVWEVHNIAHGDEHIHDDHDHHDHAHSSPDKHNETAENKEHSHAPQNTEAIVHNHDHADDDHNHDGPENNTATDSIEISKVESEQNPINNEHQHEEELVKERPLQNSEFIKNIGQDMLEDQGVEITALLLQYNSPTAMSVIPRLVNQSTNMQAASPAIESARIFSLLGVGLDSLEILAYVIMVIAALSVFISLYNALKNRKYDLAIMRTMGASKTKLFTLIIVEGFVITLIGGLIGLIFGHLVLAYITTQTSESADFINAFQVYPFELIILVAAVIIGIVASLIPAIKAYKTTISKTLSSK